jgi:hypothetical protein
VEIETAQEKQHFCYEDHTYHEPENLFFGTQDHRLRQLRALPRQSASTPSLTIRGSLKSTRRLSRSHSGHDVENQIYIDAGW